VDPITDVDWVSHWRDLVVARAAQISDAPQTDFWAQRAATYPTRAEEGDHLMTFLEPWLSPHKSLLDVGAGTGRYAAPLAERLAWVTAIEPEQLMWERIPDRPNITVIASTLEDSDPARADLLLCAHVLYPIAEVVPFIKRLEAGGRERVFIALRDSANAHPAEAIVPRARVREPRLSDCYMLLRQIGIEPDLILWRQSATYRWPDLESALADCRGRVGRDWNPEQGRAFLESSLVVEPSTGGLVYQSGDNVTGVLHWRPRG